MEKSIIQIERELREAKIAEFNKQQKIKRRAKEEFEKKNKVNVYSASDYCGMSNGKHSFYYGYEETMCPTKSHKNIDDCDDNNCDKREWCFTADIDGKEVMRVPQSELVFDTNEPLEVLLAGIGKFLLSTQPQ